MKLFLFFLSLLFFTFCGCNLNSEEKYILQSQLINNTIHLKDNHAPTILLLKSTILVAWYAGKKEGDSSIGIYLSRKNILQKKWSKPIKIIGTGLVPCWNPVLFQLKDGKIVLFYKEGFNIGTWESKLIISNDNGNTWSKSILLDNSLFGPVKNKPIYTKNDKILCGTSDEKNTWKVYFSLTKDLLSWEEVKDVKQLDNIHAIQPTLLMYKNGKIQAISRTSNGFLSETWSYDSGESWSPMVTMNIPSSNSGIDGVVLENQTSVVIHNPYNKDKRGRNKLSIFISKDSKKWCEAFVLEDHLLGEYSYPSITVDKKGMGHIVYSYERKNIKYLQLNLNSLECIIND